MTQFESEMINVLNKATQTDWAAILGNIIGTLIISLVSALIAYRVAKIQTESQIKKQNELEILKEKRMLVTTIKLEKYELLFDSLTEYLKLVGKSYFNVMHYAYPDDYNDKISLEGLRRKEKNLQNEIGIWSRKTVITSAYIPGVRVKWEELSKLYFYIANIIYDGFTYCDRFKRVVEDPSFENLENSYNQFNVIGIEIQDYLTNMMVNTIKELEGN